jgi:hypothetical protein
LCVAPATPPSQAFKISRVNGKVVVQFKHRSDAPDPELQAWGGMAMTTCDGAEAISIQPFHPPQQVFKEGVPVPDFRDMPAVPIAETPQRKLKDMQKLLRGRAMEERLLRCDPVNGLVHLHNLHCDLRRYEVRTHSQQRCNCVTHCACARCGSG